MLECGIYRCGEGFEARIGYAEKRIASDPSPELAKSREAADEFRRRTLDKHGYTDIPMHLASIEPFPGGRIVRNGGRMTIHTRSRRPHGANPSVSETSLQA